MGDYDDDSDVDAAHVHDAAGNIIERRPKTALFIMALREEVFLGAEVHNQQMQEKIQGFKGPTAPTKKALNDTKKYLDSMDSMVKVLSGYKDCASAEYIRRKEFRAVLKRWGKTDTMGLPIILFIAAEREKEQAGTATFRDLIASLQNWLTKEIHERMISTVSGKTVNALAATTGCNFTAQTQNIRRKTAKELSASASTRGKATPTARDQRTSVLSDSLPPPSGPTRTSPPGRATNPSIARTPTTKRDPRPRSLRTTTGQD